MGQITREHLDSLEAKRDTLTPDQTAALDRAQSLRKTQDVDHYLHGVNQLVKAGRYVDSQHDEGVVRTVLENAAGYEPGRPIPDMLKDFGLEGMSTRDAASKFIGSGAEAFDVDGHFLLTDEQQQDAVSAKIRKDHRKNYAMASLGRTLSMPATAPAVPVLPPEADVDNPETRKAAEEEIQNEAFAASPALMRRWARENLSPKSSTVAFAIAHSNDPEKTALYYEDVVANLSAEEAQPFWSLVYSMNPEIEKSFGGRMMQAVWNGPAHVISGTGDWFKGQGLDVMTPNDNPREWFDRVTKEFTPEEIHQLRSGDADSDLYQRMDKLANLAAGVGSGPADHYAVASRGVLGRQYKDSPWKIFDRGQEMRRREAISHEVSKAMQPKYSDLGGFQEKVVDITQATSHMVSLAAVSAIPGAGPAVSGFLMYAPQQAEWERSLIYDHGVDPSHAQYLSTGFAAAYASVERLQVKQLDPKINPLTSVDNTVLMKTFGHYFGERAKNNLKRMGVETFEEYLQEDIEFAMLATAKGLAGAEGIDLSEEFMQKLRNKIDVTTTMPFVTLFGGGAIQTGRAGKAAVKGDFKGAVKELVSPEMRQARDDANLDHETWQATRKARVLRQNLGADNLIPVDHADIYRMHHDNKYGFGDLNAKTAYKNIDDWMEQHGYTEADHERFQQSVEFYNAVSDVRRAEILDALRELGTHFQDTDDVPLPLDSDPYWGAVDLAQETIGDKLGFKLLKYDTLEEAQEKHPELAGKEFDGVAINGNTAIVIKGERTAGQLYQKWRHEVIGHLVQQNFNGDYDAMLQSMRDILGDDIINGMMKRYTHAGIDEKAEEVMALFIEKLDLEKIKAEVNGRSIAERLGGWLDEALGTKSASSMNAESLIELVQGAVNIATDRAAEISDPVAQEETQAPVRGLGTVQYDLRMAKKRGDKAAVARLKAELKEMKGNARFSIPDPVDDARVSFFEKYEVDTDSEGNVIATHDSPVSGLKVIDPAKAGTGPLKGKERFRGGPKKSFFGIGSYKKEIKDAEGQYSARIPAHELYPILTDPLNIREQDGVAYWVHGRNNPDFSAMEQRVKEMGYKGYIGGNSFGPVVAMFDETPVAHDLRKVFVTAPVPEVGEIATKYKEENGLDPDPGLPILAIDTARAMKIADAYDALVHAPFDPEVKAAYEALATETLAQYQLMMDAGYTVEFYEGQGEPYASSRQMIADLNENKHMWVFGTEAGYGDDGITDKDRAENPMLAVTEFKDANGKPMVVNDLFRAVHDFFGHGGRGNAFGALGEENAWDLHSRMFSYEARRALTTETRGQNSWVNYGPQMRGEDGQLLKRGDAGYLSPRERRFADQKIALMEPEYVRYSLLGNEHFMAWFQDSQVVDEHGDPLKVYHGTDAEFTVFEANEPNNFSGTKDLKGIYFTDDPNRASAYTRGAGRRPDGAAGRVVMPVYVSLQNPLDITDSINNREKGVSFGDAKRAALEALENGHDGVVFRGDDVNGAEYIAFYPEQVKSVDNRGTYDASNPDIRYSLEDPSPSSTVAIFRDPDLLQPERMDNGRTKVYDLGVALEQRAIEEGYKLDVNDYSDAAINQIAEAMADDVSLQLENDDSGIGWYDLKTRSAMELMSRVHPELKTDPEMELRFKAALAMISQNNAVDLNFEATHKLWKYYKAKGKLPTWPMPGKSNKIIKKNLKKVYGMIDEFGHESVTATFQEVDTVKSWKAQGYKVNGELMGTEITGAMAIMGSKIGSFWGNLNGDFSTLTADLWYSRTWNRYTGNMLAKSDPVQDRKNVLAELAAYKGTKLLYGFKRREIRKNQETFMAWLEAVVDHYAASGYEDKQELNIKANTALKNFAGSLQDIPRNGTERVAMRKAIAATQQKLEERGFPRLEIADLQAILWYNEKDLYTLYKATTEKSEKTDYETAAQAVLRKEKVDDTVSPAFQRTDSDGRADASGDGLDGAQSRRDEAAVGQAETRYSLAARSDPSEFSARTVAGHIVQGRKATRQLVKQILAAQNAEQVAVRDIDAIIERAKEIAAQVIGMKDQIVSDRDLSRMVNSTADQITLRNRMEKISKDYFKEGAGWQKVMNDQVKLAETTAERLRRSRRGLSVDDLSEAVDFPIADVLDHIEADLQRLREERQQELDAKEQAEKDAKAAGLAPEEVPETVTAPMVTAPWQIREVLDQVAFKVVQKMHQDGILTGAMNSAKINAHMRKPYVLEEYKKSIETMMDAVIAQSAHGPTREYLRFGSKNLLGLRTRKAVDKAAVKLLETAFANKANEDVQTVIENILKATKKISGQMKARQADGKRDLPARVIGFLKMVRGGRYNGNMYDGALLMSQEAVDKEIETTRKWLENPSQNAPSTWSESEVRQATADKMDRLNALMRFGAMKDKTPGEAADAEYWLNEKMEKAMEMQEKRRAAAEKKAGAFRNKLYAVLPNREKGKGRKNWFHDANTAGYFLETRLQEIALFGKGTARDEALEDLNKLAFDFAAGSFRKNAAVAADNRAMGDALLRIYRGTVLADGAKGQAKIEISEQRDRDRAGKILKELQRKRASFDKFSLNEHDLSKANLMQIIGMLEQEDYRKVALLQIEFMEQDNLGQFIDDLKKATKERIKFTSRHGYELDAYQLDQVAKSIGEGAYLAKRYEMLEDMREALTEQDLKVLEWMRSYYRENREALSAKNEEVTGLPFPIADPNYIPAKVDFTRNPVSGLTIHMPLVPASLTPRQFQTRDVDEDADLFQIYMNRADSNHNFLQMSDLYQEVQLIFADDKLIKRMENAHGKNFVKHLFTHMRDVLSGKPNKGDADYLVVDKMVNYFAATKLGFNLSLLPRQVTSLPSFALYVDTPDFFRYVSGAWTAEGKAAMREIFDHPLAQTRMANGRTQIETDLFEGMGEKGLSFWEGYKRLGALPTKYGDIIPTLIFGQGYYRAQLAAAKQQGMRPEEGREWAMSQLFRLVEMSQQSGNVVNLTSWQRHGGSMGRALGQFTSTPQQFWTKEVQMARELFAARELGKGSPRHKAAMARFGKTLVINHALLPLLYNGMKLIWNYLLGDEPDEDDLWALGLSMLSGPFAGFFVFGAVMVAFVEGATTGERGYGNSLLSISGIADDTQTASAALNHLLTGDFDDLLKDLDKLGRSNQAIYRDISKAIENYSE